MKVLFFARALMVGGVERQLALLTAGLARRGHDVAVVVLYDGGAFKSILRDSGVRRLLSRKVESLACAGAVGAPHTVVSRRKAGLLRALGLAPRQFMLATGTSSVIRG
jgi:hypothetical protein